MTGTNDGSANCDWKIFSIWWLGIQMVQKHNQKNKKTKRTQSPYLLVRNVQKGGDTGHLHILFLQQSCALGENMIPNMNHFTPQQEIGTQSTNLFFSWNHPHTLWIKACAGLLIGTRAKENCSVTVNRQISWLKRLNKVVFWPWIPSPRMRGALLVSQWEAVAGKRKRSAVDWVVLPYIF